VVYKVWEQLPAPKRRHLDQRHQGNTLFCKGLERFRAPWRCHFNQDIKE
jgi:hypothetical protein